ncbi:hypothetical protein [Pseudopontixanthobacter vadosimaris]|uniref:hypothetical protein n=1 Tax=Pseudopontixanthobacter vadosimaris TaxID=2726450 RepID=UPI0014737549|nr:hypothetical protein [Pseudopontixanthobacter vadosimaris]
MRVVIRHRLEQNVDLFANGKPVDPLAFDGVSRSPDGQFAIPTWRGIPSDPETTRLTAVLRNSNGSVAELLERSVMFTSAP